MARRPIGRLVLNSLKSKRVNCQGLIFLLYLIILLVRENPAVYVNGLDVLNQHFLHWEFGLYGCPAMPLLDCQTPWENTHLLRQAQNSVYKRHGGAFFLVSCM